MAARYQACCMKMVWLQTHLFWVETHIFIPQSVMSEFALIARECVNADIRANPSISGEGNLAPGPQPPLAAAAAWLSAKCLGRSTDKWLPSD